MKKIIIVAVAFLLSSPAVFAQLKADKKGPEPDTALYVCPMHADVTSNKSGKCSKCGMNLNFSKKEQFKTEATNTYSCSVHPDLMTHDPGKCPKCGKKLNLSSKQQMKAEMMKIYTCPMHPDVSLDKEGNCPKCGKAMVEKKKE